MKDNSYKHLLTKYNLTSEKLGIYLGYSSGDSFRNSSAYRRILKGISRVIAEVERQSTPDPGKPQSK